MIYLVDASVYVFRAWFSLPDSLIDARGRPVNAVYGFARFMGDLLERARPDYAAVAFDESLTTSFRNELYPAYKANRELPPPELEYQFALCRELVRALGVTEHATAHYEADDIIGTLAAAAHARRRKVVIVTRDKDLAQLLRGGDAFYDPATGRRLGYADIRGEFGVHPEQMADFLALTGDSVDNIPGVPGIGKKTAAALLEHFDSLDDIYRDPEQVLQIGLRGARRVLDALEANREQLAVARRLTDIARDVPIGSTLESLRREPPRLDELDALYDRLRFGQGLREQARRIAEQSKRRPRPENLDLFPEGDGRRARRG